MTGYWAPLKHALPDLVRHTYLFMGGAFNGRVDGDFNRDGHAWVSGTGLFTGTFVHDYLGIPATGWPVSIRWGECCRLQDGRIAETYLLMDFIDLMQQAGVPVLPPSLGRDGLYPPPAAGDGVLRIAQDAAESAYSLAHIRRFIFEGLNRFDKSELKSMGMAHYFHTQVHLFSQFGIDLFERMRQQVAIR